jgi:hypothetical protein
MSQAGIVVKRGHASQGEGRGVDSCWFLSRAVEIIMASHLFHTFVQSAQMNARQKSRNWAFGF